MKKNGQSIFGSVLVVGGGVAGVQASLDLSELGFYVYLIEKSASIGGVMAQLDKTFPTNDCSLCILSPKLVEASRSPNIKIITNADLIAVEGEVGNFTAKIYHRARYIREDICTGCGICAQYCPTLISDSYNERLSSTKVLHMDYPQAVPTCFYIDPKKCLFLNYETCKICVPTCKANAIDFKQKNELLEIPVGAVILCPGFGRIDDGVMGRYGYGRYPDVITSLQFERILCASGPYEGAIVRPSDGTHPGRIAYIQCVGSRDVSCGNGYCSSVCCMYAVKEAIVAKEHDPNLEQTIFYMDMRTQGKGFDAARERAREQYGVRFIRARVSRVEQLNGNLRLNYMDERGHRKSEEFDMVVLSIGLDSPPGAKSLAKAVEIGLNKYDFAKTNPFFPLETTRPGIFVAGAFQSPKDIPESVTQASGSAACVSEILRDARGSQVIKREYPPEIDVGEQEPRIGVFICHCGINIGSVVNVPEVRRYAATLENVVYVEENPYSCSQDTQETIKQKIKEHNLNRLVVAACTPRTHEPLFQETMKEAGLNRALFEMANIRDQCSWVHMANPLEATEKAKDLVRMAVAKARLIRPLKEATVPVIPKGLVIGGGISGMTAALSLANQGFECFIVEKEEKLGGNLRNTFYTLEGQDPQKLLREFEQKIGENPLIHVYTEATIENISGYVGNFTTSLNTKSGNQVLDHGIIIVATGALEHRTQKFLYGKSKQVVTQSELERMLSSPADASELKDVVMIQCAGSRDEELPYCSKICCGQAVKNALRIKELNPASNVYILYRDIRTYGFMEDYYREAREKGVVFIHYEKEREPQVIEEGGQLKVKVVDPLLEETLVVKPNLVALSVGMIAGEVEQLSKILKIPLTEERFFLEAHVKLRPVEFSVEGVYLCGLAHFPKPIEECVAQAKAAAAKAAILLTKGFVVVEPVVSSVNPELCIGCGICESLCPYKAIRLIKVDKKRKAETISASCKGCGICAAHCPKMAISMGRFRDEEICAQIRAFLEGGIE